MDPNKIVRGAISAGIVEYCQRKKLYNGDEFATDEEMRNILAEPMEYADILPQELQRFIDAMLESLLVVTEVQEHA
jgi:hypothetical protein